MNSVFVHRNQVQWTRFTILIPLHQQFLVTWVLSWKSSLLDSISMNGPQPSTCCRGSQLRPVFLLVRLFTHYTLFTHYFLSILFTHYFLSLLTTFLSYLTQHSSHTTSQVSSYNIVIICQFFFFFVSVNIVINLFVSILLLVYLLVYCDYLLFIFF